MAHRWSPRAKRILGGPNPRPVWQFLYMLRLFTSVGILLIATVFMVMAPAI